MMSASLNKVSPHRYLRGSGVGRACASIDYLRLALKRKRIFKSSPITDEDTVQFSLVKTSVVSIFQSSFQAKPVEKIEALLVNYYFEFELIDVFKVFDMPDFSFCDNKCSSCLANYEYCIYWGKGNRSFVQATVSGNPTSGLYGCVRNDGEKFHGGLDLFGLKRDKDFEALDSTLCASRACRIYQWSV